jgi:hypothetical protein
MNNPGKIRISNKKENAQIDNAVMDRLSANASKFITLPVADARFINEPVTEANNMGNQKITHLGNAESYTDAINLWQTRNEIIQHNEICYKSGRIIFGPLREYINLITFNMPIINFNFNNYSILSNNIIPINLLISGYVEGGVTYRSGGFTRFTPVWINSNFVINEQSVQWFYDNIYDDKSAVYYILSYIKVNKNIREIL